MPCAITLIDFCDSVILLKLSIAVCSLLTSICFPFTVVCCFVRFYLALCATSSWLTLAALLPAGKLLMYPVAMLRGWRIWG